MNAEYQRLEAAASDLEREMRELATTVELSLATTHAKFGQQIAELGRKLASVHHGMALLRAVNSSEMRQREREFVKALPRKFHSQGMRKKVIHLPGGVMVSLSVTYYHRCQCPKAGKNDRRGLFPM
jgi:hypothetical protein